MAQRAITLMPKEQRGYSSSATSLNLAVAGGPCQPIYGPWKLKATYAESLIQEALFGRHRLFNASLGVKPGMEGAALVLAQERGNQVTLMEEGSIVISMPARKTGQMGTELVEEVVQAQFGTALGYAS